MARRASTRKRASRKPSPLRTGYLERTRRPLYCLAFLLPMLVLYEVGIFLAYPPMSDIRPPEVMAKVLLSWLMSLFGVTGYYLPGLIVVLVLLIWHVVRKDTWQVDKPVLVGMAVESVLLALPLLLYHAALASSSALSNPSWADAVLLSMSAGIYEELVFRLLLINVLTFVLTGLIHLKRGYAEIAAVVLSSVIFALHHCEGLGGTEPFIMTRFLFRAAAGVYLAGVFVLRGFGIAVGCHTVYDIIVVSIR